VKEKTRALIPCTFPWPPAVIELYHLLAFITGYRIKTGIPVP